MYWKGNHLACNLFRNGEAYLTDQVAHIALFVYRSWIENTRPNASIKELFYRLIARIGDSDGVLMPHVTVAGFNFGRDNRFEMLTQDVSIFATTVHKSLQ